MGWDISLLFAPRHLDTALLLEAAKAAYAEPPGDLVALVADETTGPASLRERFERFSIVSLWSDEPLHKWDDYAREIAERLPGVKLMLAVMSDHGGVGGHRVLEDGAGEPGVWLEEGYTEGAARGLRAAYGLEVDVEAEDLALAAERGVTLFSTRDDYPAGRAFGADAARAVIEAGSMEWCCAQLDLGEGAGTAVDTILLLAEAGELESEIADALVAKEPGAALSWLVRGIARSVRGILDGTRPLMEAALEDANEALAREPDLLRARELRADLLACLGRHAESLVDLDELIAADPGAGRAFESRGVARLFVGDLGGARTDLDEAIVLEPSSYARWVSALLRHATGDAKGALLDARLAAALDATDVPPALLLAALGEPPKSLARIEDGFERALADYLRGKSVEAELIAAAGRSSDPPRRRCEAHAYVAIAAEHQGDLEGARSACEACIATDASDQLEFAWARVRLGRGFTSRP